MIVLNKFPVPNARKSVMEKGNGLKPRRENTDLSYSMSGVQGRCVSIWIVVKAGHSHCCVSSICSSNIFWFSFVYWFYLLSETFFNEMSYVLDLFNIMDLNCNLNLLNSSIPQHAKAYLMDSNFALNFIASQSFLWNLDGRWNDSIFLEFDRPQNIKTNTNTQLSRSISSSTNIPAFL